MQYVRAGVLHLIHCCEAEEEEEGEKKGVYNKLIVASAYIAQLKK